MPIFSVPRILKMGLTNFWRNIWLSAATTLVMVLTLFSFSILVVLNLLGNATIKNIEQKIDVTIYLKDVVTEEETLALKTSIEEISNIANIEYISKKEALENFSEKHQNDKMISDILKEFETNPLEPVLVIKANQPEDYPGIVDKLEEERYAKFIRKVNYKDNQLMIDRITATANSLGKAGIIVSIIFAAIAILVMFNTIRLTIYSRSKEIEIMKLVGATNWYVRWPMIIEGVLYGLVASVISLGILFPASKMVSPKIEAYFYGYGLNLAQYLNTHILQIIGIQILIGILLGVISSLIAIGKYLDK